MSLPEMTPQELEALRKTNEAFFILDVRNQDEFDEANLGGHLIPLNELPNRLDELNKNDLIVVHCQGGGRSSRACQYLLEQGFKKVYNLKGGLRGWQQEVG